MRSSKSSRRSLQTTVSTLLPNASKSQPLKSTGSSVPADEREEAIREIAGRLPELERVAKELGLEKVEALLQFARADLDAAMKARG